MQHHSADNMQLVKNKSCLFCTIFISFVCNVLCTGRLTAQWLFKRAVYLKKVQLFIVRWCFRKELSNRTEIKIKVLFCKLLSV
jgi:hypothetical protein